MGFFQKLFGRATPAAPPADDKAARIAELLATPPRLINEGPEFPSRPIVVRPPAIAALDATLAGAGFVAGEAGRWTRGATIVERTTDANGLGLLAFSGAGVIDAQRALLAAIPWVDPTTLYTELENRKLAPAALSYLLWAARHYRCAGGVPAELRSHTDAGVKETIRLIDRDVMAEAARARRNR